MSRFVLGDIHGRIDYLKDVLQKSKFDYENDQLIFIGDIVDRGLHPFECVKELQKVKNLVCIRGNHDSSWEYFMESGRDMLGEPNGTVPTKNAWDKLSDEDKASMKLFFAKMVDYYIPDNENIIFTHGGFNREDRVLDQTPSTFQWDRDLVTQAMSCSDGQKLKTKDNFDLIYIGHTPTIYWGLTLPIYKGGVINIDTGSGKGGPLTIMDIDSQAYWQSTLSMADHTKLKGYGINPQTEEDQEEGGDKGSSEGSPEEEKES